MRNKENYKPQKTILKKQESREVKDVLAIKSFKEAAFLKGKGCSHCNGQGYKGRVGIFEVLEVSENIQGMIGSKATADEIEAQAKKEGMLTMFQDGVVKVLKGVTTLEEVLRVTEE